MEASIFVSKMEYGLIGEHLGHSFSKEIHGLIGDYEYNLKEIKSDDLDGFMRSKQFKGINVTIPYKQAVIPYLDYIDDSAKAINAVNTIVNKDGKLYGYNTDFMGLEALIKKLEVSLENKKVLILGAGATSKTARAVCEHLKAQTILNVSRHPEDEQISYAQALSDHQDAQIIINATPCGMYPHNDDCPIVLDSFMKLEAVVDVIYNPLKTVLIQTALKRNVKAEGGLYMLVAQALYAAEKFLDQTFDKKYIDAIYQKILKDKQNIVLTGMPACGKSTAGRGLAKKLNRELFDSDKLIEQLANKSIPEIFEQEGEEKFRDYEQEAIRLLASKSGCIIASGGGAILREENINHLKQNGIIFFIDRPLKNLIPTQNRPTANSVEQIKKRYHERYDRYVETSDVIIKASPIKSANVEMIEEEFFNENTSD